MAIESKELEALFEEFCKNLKGQLPENKDNAAFLNVIRQFLKDNNIQCIPTKNNNLGGLLDALNAESADEVGLPFKPN